ncbi:MAG: roadblock/LC7 domain-containing protein [Chloroflexota bacterium]
MTKSLLDLINKVLNEFEKNVPNIEATAVFDTDGLVIASRLPGGVDEQIIGAMTAAILSISNRSGEELERGKMRRVLVEGDAGSIIIMSVGEDLVLVTLVRENVKLGILFYELNKCVSRISDVLNYKAKERI